MGFSFFLVNQKYCIIKLSNYNKKNIKIINMKTKNILKIGIFSIVLFALLISPILKTIIQVDANGEVLKTTQEIESSLVDKNAMTICQVDTDKWIAECRKDHNDLLCEAQGSFILSWCEIVKGTLEGLGKMFAGLINLEIDWILKALDPAAYGGMVTNKGVIAIWTILRNIVNSLLVLGLIGIAIATILGYKKYAWKQILWKLILVALLVNFSLVISGIVVDVSNYLAGYFLSISQENSESIAPRIMKGYGYTKVANTAIDQYDPPYIFGEGKYETTQIAQDEDAKKEVDKYTLGFGNFFIITFIMILVGGFAIIALLSIFLTVVVRNFLLIMLLGLSPIVFAAWIFPDTEKYWKMWWDNFLKWCFFPIIFAFTLYLALTVMNNMPAIGTDSPMVVSIIQMVLFSMFLVGGLIFSLQGGGAVSQTIIKQTSKIGTAMGAKVGKTVTSGVQGSKAYRAAGKKLTQVPLLSKLGHNMLDQSDRAQSTADIKKYEKDMEGRDPSEIKDIANRKAPSRMNKDAYAHYMAARNIALKNGDISDGDKAIDSIKEDIRNDNPDLNVKIVRDALPHLFRIGSNGKLEAIDKSATDYTEQVINNIKNIKPENLPKDTEKIVATAEIDINKFFQGLLSLKTNQIRAFFDNVSAKEYTEGSLFGGTSTDPKPWTGDDGEVAKNLKKMVNDAYANLIAAQNAGIDITPYNDALVKTTQTVDELNKKLKTSSSLRETFGADKI